jgi:hypothetical protein
MKREVHRSFPDDYEHVSTLSRALREEARKNGRTDIVQMLKTGDFISVCSTDLDILIDHLCCRPSQARASLYARVACLIICEWFDDVPFLTGKAYQNIVGALTGEEGLREFRSITKELSRIRKTHEANVREIRNVAIAHRDHDVEAQLAIMEALDFVGIVALATELTRWHTLFIRFQSRMWNRLAEELGREREKGNGPTGST